MSNHINAFQIFLIFPVFTVLDERNVSKLKLIKKIDRHWTKSNLSIILIETDIIKDIN